MKKMVFEEQFWTRARMSLLSSNVTSYTFTNLSQSPMTL